MLKNFHGYLLRTTTRKSTDISRNTIFQYLNKVGLTGHINVKRPLISAKNKKTRLDFIRKYEH